MNLFCNQKYILIIVQLDYLHVPGKNLFYKREFEWLDKDGYDESADNKCEAI